MSSVIHIISKLLNPIPQYVVGCLPAIAIVGESPKEKFTGKLVWVLRCLGCPFTGLLYSCNVGKSAVNLCIYWLTSNHFLLRDPNPNNPQPLGYRPIGIYTQSMSQGDIQNIDQNINQCTGRTS